MLWKNLSEIETARVNLSTFVGLPNREQHRREPNNDRPSTQPKHDPEASQRSSQVLAGVRAYVEQGVLPGKELQTHLDYVANYKAAEKEAMKAIGCDHTFPPADYQSPLPYESLLAEDIM